MNTDEHRLTWVLVGAIGLCSGAAHSGGGGPPEYEVTAIIEGFQCGDHLAAVSPRALNEAGDVAGYTTCNLVQRAFRWTAETGLELVPTPDGTSRSRALAIADSKVVGWYDNAQLELGTTGFLYDFETDQFTSLGTLPGGNWSEAHAINSAGEIVGFWGDVIKGPFPQAFIWRDGEMIDINGDFGTPRSEANGITDDSVVTGWMGSSILSDARAFIWDNRNVTELPPIPGGFTSIGRAINQNGLVAGEGAFVLDDGKTTVVRSFLWADNQMTKLSTLPGTTFTRARSINNQTRIVGYGHNQFLTDQAAFVWQDGVIAALNDLIPFDPNLNLERAMGINQTGQIAVAARSDALDASVGVLLSPKNNGIPGDLDNDGQVGASDLLILLSSWGPCDNCEDCPADLNSDCDVGATDLLILLENWG